MTTRARLLKTSGWLVALLVFMLLLIGSQYLRHLQWPPEWDAQIYIVLAYFSHFALLGFLPWLLIILPLTLLLPKPWLILPLTVLLGGAGAAWMLLDALLFAEHQFHINALTMTILGWHTWLFGVVYLLIFVLLGAITAGRLWKTSSRKNRKPYGPILAVLIIASYATAQAQHIWADANYYVPVTSFSHYLPYYHPLMAKGIMVSRGWVDLDQIRERQLLDSIGQQQSQLLNYPQNPLQCGAGTGLNLLMIVIDTMRYDMLAPETAPNIHQFARKAANFHAHYSGGNSSRMGMFSLFYGLPSNYWQNFQSLQRAPVIMERLIEQNYQIAVFSGGPLYRPVSLDRTAFAQLKNLDLNPNSTKKPPYALDRDFTNRWIDWLAKRDTERPFYGFLFYDSPSSFNSPPKYPQFAVDPGDKMPDEFARYRTSVHYIDRLVGKVLKDLGERDLLASTVVLITSDHGEEFNENGLGFVRHGTAFGREQLHVPFVVHWPGKGAANYLHRTSHSDWSVTLMQDLFNCTNSGADFASGKNLYDEQSWQWMIAGGYDNFAIVEPDQVIISHFIGTMEVRDRDYQLANKPLLREEVISAALQETNRFYLHP